MKRNTARGFTLIELLIVIGVLGILAVAVLSAINPIEQINRSRDTGSKSDAEQLIGAVDRFYAVRGFYPWVTGAGVTNYTLSWTQVGDSWTVGSSATSVLDLLSTTSGTEELKSSFTDRVSDEAYNSLYIYNAGGAGNSTYVCFIPKSGAFKTEADERCGDMSLNDFPTTNACGATTYICLP